MKKHEWEDLYNECVLSFLRVEGGISDIILLGANGGIRRISDTYEYTEETK